MEANTTTEINNTDDRINSRDVIERIDWARAARKLRVNYTSVDFDGVTYWIHAAGQVVGPVATAPVSAVRTMSSREIAELTGKRHDHVLRDIERMLDALNDVRPNFGGYYVASNGKRNREYNLPKRETLVLVSGYNVQMRARIIDRWQELEQQAQQPAPALNDPAFLRTTLLAYTERVIELESTVSKQIPKVKALDRIATAQGSLSVRDAAKVLQVRPIDLSLYLQTHRWIFKQSQEWRAYQSRISSGLVEHKEVTIWANPVDKIVVQVRVTPKGLARLAEAFETELQAA
ncbi:hypothetical protein DFQ30_000569 [Apophysomyces sp. BC1015]|nr:hypothetical protein DFQ30_000569 [Apophysomyces sp. BC1015]